MHTPSASTRVCARARDRGFASDLGVSLRSDLPTVAVVSAARRRAAVMPQRFVGEAGFKAASAFIDGVLGGRIKTQSLEVCHGLRNVRMLLVAVLFAVFVCSMLTANASDTCEQ